MTVECNAIIRGATLTITDHGYLAACVDLDYGDGTRQGFGGYTLFNPAKPEGRNFCGWYLLRVLEIADVIEWGKLPGKAVRVRKKSGEFDAIEAIGHIIKDDWFYPSFCSLPINPDPIKGDDA